MINFTPGEFNKIWDILIDDASTNWNTVRVRKSAFKGKEVLFMMLKVLKHGGKWDFIGQMFIIKGATFEKLIVGLMKIVSHPHYDYQVKEALILPIIQYIP